jgi:hypothetical protein
MPHVYSIGVIEESFISADIQSVFVASFGRLRPVVDGMNIALTSAETCMTSNGSEGRPVIDNGR